MIATDKKVKLWFKVTGKLRNYHAYAADYGAVLLPLIGRRAATKNLAKLTRRINAFRTKLLARFDALAALGAFSKRKTPIEVIRRSLEHCPPVGVKTQLKNQRLCFLTVFCPFCYARMVVRPKYSELVNTLFDPGFDRTKYDLLYLSKKMTNQDHIFSCKEARDLLFPGPVAGAIVSCSPAPAKSGLLIRNRAIVLLPKGSDTEFLGRGGLLFELIPGETLKKKHLVCWTSRLLKYPGEYMYYSDVEQTAAILEARQRIRTVASYGLFRKKG